MELLYNEEIGATAAMGEEGLASGDTPPVATTPLHAQKKLLRILSRIHLANLKENGPEERRQKKRLKQLEEEGVESLWWTQEGFEKEKGALTFSSSEEDDSDIEEVEKSAGQGATASRKRQTMTKDTVTKSLPFDQLIAPQDQCWLTPYRSSKYRTLLVHSPLTIFQGEPALDKTTVAQWARVTSDTLFKDVGAPLEEAVRLLGRCFPDSSRARIWYMKYTAARPEATFDEFIKAFVPAFTDPELVRRNRAALFNLRQLSLPFSAFAGQHAVLWYRVHPDAPEADMVLNWEMRLNSQCTPVFQKYLARVARDNLSPTFNHAVEHMDEKLQNRAMADTIFTIVHDRTLTTGSEKKMVECDKGCRRRRHEEGSECPAVTRKCIECGVVGHFRASKLCPMFRMGARDRRVIAAIVPPPMPALMPPPMPALMPPPPGRQGPARV